MDTTSFGVINIHIRTEKQENTYSQEFEIVFTTYPGDTSTLRGRGTPPQNLVVPTELFSIAL